MVPPAAVLPVAIAAALTLMAVVAVALIEKIVFPVMVDAVPLEP